MTTKWTKIPSHFWFDPTVWSITCLKCKHKVTRDSGLCAHLARGVSVKTTPTEAAEAE